MTNLLAARGRTTLLRNVVSQIHFISNSLKAMSEASRKGGNRRFHLDIADRLNQVSLSPCSCSCSSQLGR